MSLHFLVYVSVKRFDKKFYKYVTFLIFFGCGNNQALNDFNACTNKGDIFKDQRTMVFTQIGLREGLCFSTVASPCSWLET